MRGREREKKYKNRAEWRQNILVKTTCSSEKHRISEEIKQQKAKS